jgi:MFS family permease
MSWTLEATGSPGLMGLFLMASTPPAVAFAPIAGAIADRHSRRALIVAADSLRGVLHVGLAAALYAAPRATDLIVPLLIATGFASGVLGALLTPALTAALPDVVPARKLAAANSLHQMSTQTATMAGQAAGGLAYGWIGATGLILIDGMTFVLSACCAALARVPLPARRADVRLHDRARAYVRDVREGVVWLWDRPRLRSLILALVTSSTVTSNSQPCISPDLTFARYCRSMTPRLSDRVPLLQNTT